MSFGILNQLPFKDDQLAKTNCDWTNIEKHNTGKRDNLATVMPPQIER